MTRLTIVAGVRIADIGAGARILFSIHPEVDPFEPTVRCGCP